METGDTVGRWLLVRKADGHRWLCRCECGTERLVLEDSLRRVRSTSCGCKRAEGLAARCYKHGCIESGLYHTWWLMRRRCEHPAHKSYADYGGRGIKVCERWHDVRMFVEDMGPRPAGASLDRINNDGNYEPSNCRWATKSEQQLNKRNTAYLEVDGVTLPRSVWAKRTGISHSLITYRLKMGWSPRDAVTTPPGAAAKRWSVPPPGMPPGPRQDEPAGRALLRTPWPRG